jgi:hypothetical protein
MVTFGKFFALPYGIYQATSISPLLTHLLVFPRGQFLLKKVSWLVSDKIVFISFDFEIDGLPKNLRGDCKDHQPQLDFLSAISSVVVVFLELETLHDQKAVQMLSVLHNSGPSGIILAIDVQW